MTPNSTITVTLWTHPRHGKPFPGTGHFPEDILMEKETEREQEAAHALMMERLREALATPDAPAGELPACPVLGGQAV